MKQEMHMVFTYHNAELAYLSLHQISMCYSLEHDNQGQNKPEHIRIILQDYVEKMYTQWHY